LPSSVIRQRTALVISSRIAIASRCSSR
jgi:hypothetical protein